ncbi:MAG: aminotransferase class IV [candidate division Zixibacteria bacterium]|nr:aminotransferase class IV [candidate division Zixibacteria bacterium]
MKDSLRGIDVATSINGKLVRHEKAVVSVFDNALLYAQGLFETFLVIDNRIIFVSDHLERLYTGAKVIDLKIPISKTTLIEWMNLTLKAHPSRIKKLRLTITAGESARWLGTQGAPQIILSAASHTMPVNPFTLFLSTFKVDQKSIFRRIKTISYAIQATALDEAKRHKCDDALMLNEKKHAAEVTSANFFWVKRNRIYTPSLDDGCLDGVTRRHVFKACQKLNFRLIEKSGTLTEILKADEIFISSSLKLIVGVAKLKHSNTVSLFPAGPVTDSLSQEFRHLVRL